MWTSDLDLKKIIKGSWNKQVDILQAIPSFTKDVTEWNKQTFENIFMKKRTLLNRLGGI